jgi:hypothetical protein
MANHIALLAALLMLSTSAMATMWTYHDPMIFQTGYSNPISRSADISLMEIVKAPYFPLLGQSFYSNALPVNLTNSSNTIQIGSKGAGTLGPIPVTFGGHLEDNLRYAQGRSSLRIGGEGSWSSLSAQGLN